MKHCSLNLIFLLLLLIFNLEAEDTISNTTYDSKDAIEKRQEMLTDFDGSIITIEAYFKNNNLIGENYVFYKSGKLKMFADIQQDPNDSHILSGYFKKFNEMGYLTDYIEFFENKIEIHKFSNGVNVLSDLDSLQFISENKSNFSIISLLYPLRKSSTPKFNEYNTPPQPIEIYFKDLTRFACQPIEGICLLTVEVFYDGFVGDIKVIKSLMAGPGGLDEIAINSVKNWKFTPALHNNRKVSCWTLIPVIFNLGTWEIRYQDPDDLKMK